MLAISLLKIVYLLFHRKAPRPFLSRKKTLWPEHFLAIESRYTLLSNQSRDIIRNDDFEPWLSGKLLPLWKQKQYIFFQDIQNIF